ncbi:MAG: thioredoxin-disulfide reductase [Candidatus Firestonebacteria bacterium]
MQNKLYDIIIIGGGPAGLTAGLYCSRAGFTTLLLEKGLLGGKLTDISDIENYPGFPDGVNGAELALKMQNQAKRFGLEVVHSAIESIKLEEKIKHVKTNSSQIYISKAIIIASGSDSVKLNVPGEDNLRGKGVSYCATCDGPLFKNASIAVIGGGDSALEEALFLTRFAKSVTIVHRRDSLRAVKILQDRALANEKIKFIWNSVVSEIQGSSSVEKLILENVKTGKKENFVCDGIFVYIGLKPNTAFLNGIIKTNEYGYIITNENLESSSPGIFAAGDVRKKQLPQISTAVGDGALASFSARKYLEEF